MCREMMALSIERCGNIMDDSRYVGNSIAISKYVLLCYHPLDEARGRRLGDENSLAWSIGLLRRVVRAEDVVRCDMR